ncbi:MAG: ADOP family duplicated permease [Gemmatimonadaceae bacterium]
MRLPLFRADARAIDDEFEYHLRRRVEELIRAGYDVDSARAEALRRFGDVDDARAYCSEEDRRRTRTAARGLFLDNLRQDVSIAWRHLRREPGFAFSAVAVLAASIGIVTAAYGIAHAYLVRPLPYPEPDRLAQIIAGPSREPRPNAPSLAAVDWSMLNDVFQATVAWDLDGFTLPDDNRPEYVDGAWVSPGYFSALGLRTAAGRGFTRQEHESGAPVAIISDALWSRRFNRDPSIVGRAIRAHSTDRPRDVEIVTIVGVMPADAWHMSRFTDILRPLRGPRMPSLARLPVGVSLAEAQRRMNGVILPQVGALADSAWHMTLVSVQDEYTFEVRPLLLALVGAAGFLMLVGCASVAGAHAARGVARRPELQLRMALGASRGRIMVQLLTEHLLVAGIAAVLGVAMADALLRAAGSMISEQLRASVPGGAHRLALDAGLLGLAILCGLAVGLVFGVIPALASSRLTGRAALAAAERGVARTTGTRTMRRGLIAAQVAFAMMLLIGAGLMVRTIMALAAEPLGFAHERVVKSTLLFPLGRYPDGATRITGVEQVLSALTRDGRVEAAAVAAPHPFRGPMAPLAIVADGSRDPGGAPTVAAQYIVSFGYFDVMRIPVLRGRSFAPSDGDRSMPVAMIGERLARQLWPDGTAIGRRMRVGRDTTWRLLIGVVGDTREVSAAEQLSEVYLPYAQVPRAYVSVMMRAREAVEPIVASATRTVAAVDDVLALADVEPLTQVVERDGNRRRALAGVLVAFSVLALALAAMGLYSSLAYLVAQRRREIAVRVAVGSRPRDVIFLVVMEAVPVVGIGLLAGMGLSVALSRLLATQLYGVSPTDPLTYATIAALIGATALAATASPIARALRIEPARLLRAD